MVVDRFIFENNQIMRFPCITFIPKTGVGLPKTGVSFHGVGTSLIDQIDLGLLRQISN